MKNIRTLIIVILSLLCATQLAAKDEFPTTAVGLRIYLDPLRLDYNDRKDERLSLLKSLIEHTEAELNKQKEDAGLTTMAGYFNAQYAGYKSGIGALKYAKTARKHLEKAIKLDPELYDAAAHTILGTLYFRVPGWPIGYGSKKKAEKNYKKAVELAPAGIEANFSYAQFLWAQERYQECDKYLRLAQQSDPRPDQTRTDKFLNEQIEYALKLVTEKLKQIE